MELPNVKNEAHRQIDSLEGSILGIVQIMIDDNGRQSVCIGGIPEVIVEILSNTMRNNHQIKDLFEAAYCKSTEIDFDSSMN